MPKADAPGHLRESDHVLVKSVIVRFSSRLHDLRRAFRENTESTLHRGKRQLRGMMRELFVVLARFQILKSVDAGGETLHEAFYDLRDVRVRC